MSNKRTYSFDLLVDASSMDEAVDIVKAILEGRTFGHEVNAVAIPTLTLNILAIRSER